MRTVLPLKSFSDKLDEKNFERDYLRISLLSSTVNKIDFVNTTEHNFVNIHLFWTIQGDLESAWHEESHHMNNGKMIPGQKVHIVDCTPKCHCKLAGEGIEYSWAASKKKI